MNGIVPKQSSAITRNNTSVAPLSSNSSSSLFYQTPLINQLSHPANSNSSASIGSSGSLHHSIYGKDHFNAKRHGGYCNYSDYKSNVCSQLCDYRVLNKENRHGKWRQVRPANMISYNYLIILFITGLAQNCTYWFLQLLLVDAFRTEHGNVRERLLLVRRVYRTGQCHSYYYYSQINILCY